MKGFLLFIVGIVVGAVVLYLIAPYLPGICPPPAVRTPNLVVRRSDTTLDHTIITTSSAQNVALMSFTVTNRNASSTYLIWMEGFYEGVNNTFPPRYPDPSRPDRPFAYYLRNLEVYMNGWLKTWRYSFYLPVFTSTTTPFAILPLSSLTFDVRVSVATSSIPAGGGTLQMALGSILATDVVTGQVEPVFKEGNEHELMPPASPVDESIESAIFDVSL